MKQKFLEREYKTIEAMIDLSCRDRHGTGKDAQCPACNELSAYAKSCLDKCPYEEQKPTCGLCPIHCYKPDMQEKIRDVMRYAGPRMFRRRPFLVMRHLFDAWKTRCRLTRGEFHLF